MKNLRGESILARCPRLSRQTITSFGRGIRVGNKGSVLLVQHSCWVAVVAFVEQHVLLIEKEDASRKDIFRILNLVFWILAKVPRSAAVTVDLSCLISS